MKRSFFPVLLIIILLLTACGKLFATEAPTATPTATFTPMPPTPTPLPMALRVNGEGVLLSDYQAALARLIQADTELNLVTTAEEQKNQIVQDYIDQLLLTQAAVQAGFGVDDATIQSRIDKLVSDIGGVETLTAWQSANGFTDESFRAELKREILAAWQRDQIINAVPTTADQIHARQILVQDEANADQAYQMLQNGADFTELAYTYDSTLGGDLGWFAAGGGLTQPEVEAAVFALQPGQYSSVIKSELGYHIIYLIERDAQHTLSVDERRILQEAALAKWLEESRAISTIEILIQ